MPLKDGGGLVQIGLQSLHLSEVLSSPKPCARDSQEIMAEGDICPIDNSNLLNPNASLPPDPSFVCYVSGAGQDKVGMSDHGQPREKEGES